MGGGLLETNNQLERFTKNKKSKKLIYTIIGILLIIGSITLFKTFAFYEEKREFNVIKGRVPEFSHEDLQLTFTINGTKGENFPTKNDGLVAKNVTCENGATAGWDNVNWSLLHIESNNNKKINCSIDFITSENINLYDNVNIGDYISYTPILDHYEVTKPSTAHTSNQMIHPSELNLWRVIRKNVDGSIDLVSEYISSTRISFKGKEDYKNYVGTLNRIANSYETPGITSGSRSMGYDGQTEFISDESKLNETIAPWGSDSSASSTPKGSEREAQGGGSSLAILDRQLVMQATGKENLAAYNVSDISQFDYYWIADRFYYYKDDSHWGFNFCHVDKEGYVTNVAQSSMPVRPIVILKSGIQAISGDGTKGSPWKVN